MDFPERIYTLDEFREARAAIAEGHKHKLVITGDDSFKEELARILDLIALAGYEEPLRTYIREIRQIEGARFVIQKMLQMQAYIEGRSWYILGELPAVRGSVEFLRKLRERLKDPELRARCDRVIREWTADAVT